MSHTSIISSTNVIRDTYRKGEASCLGTTETTPGQSGTRRRSRLRWGTPAPGLHRRLQRPIRQNSKGNKAGEYLVYPRVLRPATKLLCMYQMERGGCIVDCKIEIQG